jgi:hypothetical protein
LKSARKRLANTQGKRVNQANQEAQMIAQPTGDETNSRGKSTPGAKALWPRWANVQH